MGDLDMSAEQVVALAVEKFGLTADADSFVLQAIQLAPGHVKRHLFKPADKPFAHLMEYYEVRGALLLFIYLFVNLHGSC